MGDKALLNIEIQDMKIDHNCDLCVVINIEHGVDVNNTIEGNRIFFAQ